MAVTYHPVKLDMDMTPTMADTGDSEKYSTWMFLHVLSNVENILQVSDDDTWIISNILFILRFDQENIIKLKIYRKYCVND